jgi:hypothetical protein
MRDAATDSKPLHLPIEVGKSHHQTLRNCRRKDAVIWRLVCADWDMKYSGSTSIFHGRFLSLGADVLWPCQYGDYAPSNVRNVNEWSIGMNMWGSGDKTTEGISHDSRRWVQLQEAISHDSFSTLELLGCVTKAKSKRSLLLINDALRSEDVWGSRGVAPQLLNRY